MKIRDFEALKTFILKKLFVKGKWGAAHTSLDNLPKSLPGHLKGAAKDAAKELIKEGFILVKITSYGHEVSLNPERAQDIKERIRRELEQP